MVLGFVLGNEIWVGEVVYILLHYTGGKGDNVEFENLETEGIEEGTGNGKTFAL
jgi:hypothetical protein